MSEAISSNPNKHFQNRVVDILVAGTAALTLAGCGSPEKPIIYKGTAAQIEGHYTADGTGNCIQKIKQQCSIYGTGYYLRLEQSRQDVENARDGVETRSFDPDVGQYAPDSVVANIEVPRVEYEAHADGSTLIFDGPPTDAVQPIIYNS